MTNFFSALIISGGLRLDNELVIDDVSLTKLDPSTGEVIKQCRLPSLPHPRAGHTMDHDMVCGGFKDDDEWRRNEFPNRVTNCISLTQGRVKPKLKSWWTGNAWRKTHEIASRRAHMSWDSPEGVVLMGGETYTEIARNKLHIERMYHAPRILDAIPFYQRDIDYSHYGPFSLETENE